MSQFFDVLFFQSLVSNLIAVLLGAALGVPLGLWLDRRSKHDAEAIAEVERRASRRDAETQVLAAVRDAVSHNRELLRQAIEALSPGSGYNVIFFNVDPRAIDVLMPRLVDRSQRFDLIARINDFRYQLEHIGRKIDTQYELVYGPAAREDDEQKRRRDEIVRSLLTHMPWVMERADTIDEIVGATIEELRSQEPTGTLPSSIS